ncbi:MAG: hypothetical protein JNK53_00310, partial [Phycisphaerae bacterium]|nr:hypothetical protein [Phycisphaerae bacterium]
MLSLPERTSNAMNAASPGITDDASASQCTPRWEPIFGQAATGMNDTVLALAEFDDGSGAGPQTYAAGAFTTANGVAVLHIAKWTGNAWEAMPGTPAGTGTNGRIYTLLVHDDGSGPALYAGGTFSSIGGVAATNIAKWNGTNWSPLGTGCSSRVHCMTAFDDGNGDALYVGGEFTSAGGQPAKYVAKWNGTSWSS